MIKNCHKVSKGGHKMNRRLLSGLVLAATALAPIGTMGTATTAVAQTLPAPSDQIVLSIGRGQLVNVGGRMADIFIADESIADVQVKSTNQIYLFGKAGGETTVYASNSAGAIIWSANVRVGTNIDSIDQMLGLAMPEAKISTATMNNTVLLTGTVAAPEDAAEAERLVSAFVGDGVNVISRLKLATPLQVNLQVRFAEVSRTLVRAIGVNLATFDGTSGFKFGVTQGREGFLPQWSIGGGVFTGGTEASDGSSLIAGTDSGSTIAGFGKFLGLDLAGALDLGEQDGLVTTLAQPNLTALSGETAEFLAGGEFPIPMSQGLGTVAIEYKKYGVSLAYTPTVLANGRISIRVRPEVSELSSAGSVTLEGFEVPALTTRRAETTVELGSGQSFMIGGLLSNYSNQTIDKTPGAGDLPILGNLFRSTSFRRGETELVIVVTPYLVKPVDANQIALPTDGYKNPTIMGHLLGMQSDGESGGVRRPVPRASEAAPTGPVVGMNEVPQQSAPVRSADAGDAKPGFNF